MVFWVGRLRLCVFQDPSTPKFVRVWRSQCSSARSSGRGSDFFTGFVGNVIIDLISGYGFSWNWSLGNGLLGLIAGLAFVRARGEELPSLRDVLTWSIVGVLLAFLFSSVTDIWVYQTAPAQVPLQYIQVIIPNIIAGAILLPILYLAYRQTQERSGR